jgi:hypothetical protein
MNTNPVVFIGISAGHRHENSALAVIERVYVPKNAPYTWVKGRLPALGDPLPSPTPAGLPMTARLRR